MSVAGPIAHTLAAHARFVAPPGSTVGPEGAAGAFPVVSAGAGVVAVGGHGAITVIYGGTRAFPHRWAWASIVAAGLAKASELDSANAVARETIKAWSKRQFSESCWFVQPSTNSSQVAATMSRKPVSPSHF
jgi:hypothetical protein